MAKRISNPEIRRWKPGQKCLISGQYAVYQQSAKGAHYKYAHQITMTEGEVFPPHGEGSVRYVLTDRTRHEGD